MRPLPRLLFPPATAIALALVAAPASAQPALVSSDPAPDATVAPTDRIEMRFSDALAPALTHAALVMTDMPGMAMHAPMPMKIRTELGADGTRLVITLAKPLPKGRYVVRYAAAVSASDRSEGSLGFRIE